MPNHKHHRGKATREDVHNNNNNAEIEPAIVEREAPVYRRPNPHEPAMHKCCMPSACDTPDEMIDESDPVDAVKVFCNNEQCTMGRWMHKFCFETWQDSVLAYLRSCGRARSWSEKQRLQNLWTKKGYDLAFKACDCKCGRGHLRKDLDYFPKPKPVDNSNRNKKKNKKKNDKPVAVLTSNKGSQSHNHVGHTASTPPISNNMTNSNFTNNNNLNLNNNGNPLIIHKSEIRNRASSFSSTGSSPPNSAGSGSPTPMSPTPNGGGSFFKKGQLQFDFFCGDTGSVVNGSIFKHRSDFSAFSNLPRHKQNPYHIKMEDEGPHGNDDTRCFVLSNLSSYKVTTIECVLCKVELPVFERYPLIDGTFFLSPQPYSDGVVQVLADGRLQYINAVCVSCLEGATDVRCYACKSKWNGSALLLGTMYSYDIFAAMPCCQKRLTCKTCRRAVVDVNSGLAFFSEYSRCIECPYCRRKDTHFIRPLSETFNVKQSIWK